MLHSLSSTQVRDHIEELRQRNVYLLVDCTDLQDAQDILAFVRSRSKPLV
jgi:biotin operon repressor